MLSLRRSGSERPPQINGPSFPTVSPTAPRCTSFLLAPTPPSAGLSLTGWPRRVARVRVRMMGAALALGGDGNASLQREPLHLDAAIEVAVGAGGLIPAAAD